MTETTTPNWPAFKAGDRQIYHVARDPARARSGCAMTWHYSLQTGIIAEEQPEHVFDTRDLPGWAPDTPHIEIICAAIWCGDLVNVLGDTISTD